MFVDADVLTDSMPVDTDAMPAEVDVDSVETPVVRLDRLAVKSPSMPDSVVDSAPSASDDDSDKIRSDDDVVLMLVLSWSSPVDTEPDRLFRSLPRVARPEDVEADNVLRLLLVAVSAPDVDWDSAEIELLAVAKRFAVEVDSELRVLLATLMLVVSVTSPVEVEFESPVSVLFVLDRPLAVDSDNAFKLLFVVDRLEVSESIPLEVDAVRTVRLLFVDDRLEFSAVMDDDVVDEIDDTTLFALTMPLLTEARPVDVDALKFVRFDASVLPAVEIELTPGSSELTTVLNCATVATSVGAEPSATLVSRRRLPALPIDTSAFAVVPVP